MENHAIYANSNAEVVGCKLPLPERREEEVLIQVLYSGVNPADTKLVKLFNCPPHVLGHDFCGRVLEMPAQADLPFKIGDIVAGYTDGTTSRPLRYGTHQSYISIPPTGVFKVPDNLCHADAAALTTVVQSANDALFNRFLLPLPGTGTGFVQGSLVIWGGATSVGMAAIQLARASGVTSIIVTASIQRHDFLKGLGATYCFDYKDGNVVEKVQAAVKTLNHGLIWGFDAVGLPEIQKLVAQALPAYKVILLVTVAPMSDERFETCLSIRHADVMLGPRSVTARPLEAERMWKALMWVVSHYGNEYKAIPVRVFSGSAGDAIKAIEEVGSLSCFGKLVLKHPLK